MAQRSCRRLAGQGRDDGGGVERPALVVSPAARRFPYSVLQPFLPSPAARRARLGSRRHHPSNTARHKLSAAIDRSIDLGQCGARAVSAVTSIVGQHQGHQAQYAASGAQQAQSCDDLDAVGCRPWGSCATPGGGPPRGRAPTPRCSSGELSLSHWSACRWTRKRRAGSRAIRLGQLVGIRRAGALLADDGCTSAHRPFGGADSGPDALQAGPYQQ